MEGGGGRLREMDRYGKIRYGYMEIDLYRWGGKIGDGWRLKKMEGDGGRWREIGDGWRWVEI